jgi:hypothetical protein
MRWITRTVLVLLAGLLLVFWLLPVSQRTAGVTWSGILLITGCTLYLSFAYHRLLSTWRGFSALTAGSFLTLAWLRWQWSLWTSPVPGVQNANIVVSLLAWILLIAVFISSVLLLIRRDASVAFMGLAWALIPLVLLGVGLQYGRLDRFTAAPLGDQLFWGMPLLWGLGMLCLGPLVFLGHYAILLARELNAH